MAGEGIVPGMTPSWESIYPAARSWLSFRFRNEAAPDPEGPPGWLTLPPWTTLVPDDPVDADELGITGLAPKPNGEGCVGAFCPYPPPTLIGSSTPPAAPPFGLIKADVAKECRLAVKSNSGVFPSPSLASSASA